MELYAQIEAEAKQLMLNVTAHHGWEHVERVYKMAMVIGAEEEANLQILRLASLLHDTGRQEETDSRGEICHAERSAEIARELLKKYDLNEDIIEQVVYCIKTHRTKGKEIPETIEAKVLFDADKLDSLGAIGIGRLFHYAGEIGSKVHNAGVELENTETYTLDDTAYREFMLHTRFNKDRLFTETGKRIAQQRYSYMKDFFDRLNKEVRGEL